MVVQVLKRQGAIPFVKTNVPQSLIRYSVPSAQQQCSLPLLNRGFLSGLILISHFFLCNTWSPFFVSINFTLKSKHVYTEDKNYL